MDLFKDIPEEKIEAILVNIRNNLDQVSLYDGHVIRRHVDIQPEILKSRLVEKELKYTTSFYDMETARFVTVGLMKMLYERKIRHWLLSSINDNLMLRGQYRTGVGYGFKKGDVTLYENLQHVMLVLEKEENRDWGFRILTSYPTF